MNEPAIRTEEQICGGGIKSIREKLYDPELSDLMVVDFSEIVVLLQSVPFNLSNISGSVCGELL